jgi:hypothetical protein
MFGGRSIDISPNSAGPRMRLTLSSIFGQVRVIEGVQSPQIETNYPQAMTGQTVQLQQEEQA